jgi:hypothetical protein
VHCDSSATVRLEVVTINGGAEGFIAAGFIEATEPQHLADLLHGVLELFATLRPRLRNGLASGLVDVALSQIAEIDQSTDHRLAAELIVAHEQCVDTFGENVFRDHGADTFNRRIDQMDDLDRYFETILSIVDVWLGLLPELRTEDGMELLVKHAIELDSDYRTFG